MAVETGTFQVVMPAMGDSVVEGTILEWHKQEGDRSRPTRRSSRSRPTRSTPRCPHPSPARSSSCTRPRATPSASAAALAEIAISEDGANGSNGSTPSAEPAVSDAPAAEAQVVDIVTPAGSESVTEGTILEWSVKVGDAVKDGDTVVEISTDKVDMELPAPADGTITEILFEEGETVGVGQVIARMTVGASAASAAGVARAVGPSQSARRLRPIRRPRPPRLRPPSPSKAATPIAQRVAAGLGVNLAGVAGSARGGRVTKDDVLAAAANVVELPEGAEKIKGGGAVLARYMDESR